MVYGIGATVLNAIDGLKKYEEGVDETTMINIVDEFETQQEHAAGYKGASF